MDDAAGLGGKAVTRSANATDGLDMPLTCYLGSHFFLQKVNRKQTREPCGASFVRTKTCHSELWPRRPAPRSMGG